MFMYHVEHPAAFALQVLSGFPDDNGNSNDDAQPATMRGGALVRPKLLSVFLPFAEWIAAAESSTLVPGKQLMRLPNLKYKRGRSGDGAATKIEPESIGCLSIEVKPAGIRCRGDRRRPRQRPR